MADFEAELRRMFGSGPFVCTRCREELPDDMPGPGVCDACGNAITEEERAEKLSDAYMSIPERWRWASFEDPVGFEDKGAKCGPTTLAAAKHAAREVRAGKEVFVLVSGASGFGKTSLACAILRDIIDEDNWRSSGCRFVFAPSIAKAFRESRFGDTPRVIVTCSEASVLVIDDLGADARYRDVVRNVIQTREIENRPTVITTGMSEEHISVPYGDGIARRLFHGDAHIKLGSTEP